MSFAGVFVLLLVLCGGTGPVEAQSQGDALQPLTLIGSGGRHGLGFGLEWRLNRRLALAGRVEKWLQPKFGIAGAGARVDLVDRDEPANVYLAGLAGAVRCGNSGLSDTVRCTDTEYHAAVAALGGAEIFLNDTRRWSAGVEAGYLHALSRERGQSTTDHFTFAALVRLRL